MLYFIKSESIQKDMFTKQRYTFIERFKISTVECSMSLTWGPLLESRGNVEIKGVKVIELSCVYCKTRILFVTKWYFKVLYVERFPSTKTTYCNNVYINGCSVYKSFSFDGSEERTVKKNTTEVSLDEGRGSLFLLCLL